MKRQLALSLALAVAFGVTMPGCISHRILVDLPSRSVTWTAEGDTLDFVDQRLALPGELGWELIAEERELSEEGDVLLRKIWRHSLAEGPVTHPLADSVGAGQIRYRESGLVTEELRLVFPSWRIGQLYGLPDEYVAAEQEAVKGIQTDPTGPGYEERLNIAEAIGHQHWAQDRYERMALRVARISAQQAGLKADSSQLAAVRARVGERLDAMLIVLRQRDPREVSTEWYAELRPTMVAASSAILGMDSARVARVADSLDARYRRWLDLEDEDVTVDVLTGGGWLRGSEADERMGDTLRWTFQGSDLADSTLVIEVRRSAWGPVASLVVLGALLGLGLGWMLRRRRR